MRGRVSRLDQSIGGELGEGKNILPKGRHVMALCAVYVGIMVTIFLFTFWTIIPLLSC